MKENKLLSFWLFAVLLVVTACTPSARATNQPGGAPANNANVSGFALRIDKFSKVEDGYVFTPILQPTTGQLNGMVIFPDSDMPEMDVQGDNHDPFVITDKTGKQYSYELVEHPSQGGSGWSYKVKGNDIAFPLTIALKSAYLTLYTQSEFPLDVGDAPQAGQKWEVNQDIDIAGNIVHIESVQSVEDGYIVRIQKTNVRALDIFTPDHDPSQVDVSQSPDRQAWVFHLSYDEKPTGNIKFVLTNFKVYIAGNWTATVQP